MNRKQRLINRVGDYYCIGCDWIARQLSPPAAGEEAPIHHASTAGETGSVIHNR